MGIYLNHNLFLTMSERNELQKLKIKPIKPARKSLEEIHVLSRDMKERHLAASLSLEGGCFCRLRETEAVVVL